MHPLEALREEFTNAVKTVLKENISKNIETLNNNRDRITISYNNLVSGIKLNFSKEKPQNQEILNSWLIWARSKVVRSYEVLNCNYYVPENFDKINPFIVNTEKVEEKEVLEEIEEDFVEAEENLSSLITENSEENMAELTPIDVLRLVSSTINKNFSGDPLALQSFIDSVNLLKSLVTGEGLQVTLKQCILSKLEGKARECISGEPNSVDDILLALRNNIKTENSQVIQGRMQALRADRVPLQDFSKKAEELAENFRRALVMEGIPSENARKMTVEKTVQMCRASARSDLAKSVLASTTFHDAKDVVAKFVIEINEESKEKQVLSYHTKNGNPNVRSGNNKRNNNNNRGYFNNPNWNNNRRYNNNNNYRRNFNNNNNRNQRRNFNNNNNNFPNNANNRNNPRYNNNQQHVRVLENHQAPQDRNANQIQFLGENQQ